ncbi:hypothetical protein BJ742DRAFT_484737 [Cladochytrium replicatum]|nr:hypothetical protein BJ742DRAFT_484737 [Cladochytrium replicatum]
MQSSQQMEPAEKYTALDNDEENRAKTRSQFCDLPDASSSRTANIFYPPESTPALLTRSYTRQRNPTRKRDHCDLANDPPPSELVPPPPPPFKKHLITPRTSMKPDPKSSPSTTPKNTPRAKRRGRPFDNITDTPSRTRTETLLKLIAKYPTLEPVLPSGQREVYRRILDLVELVFVPKSMVLLVCHGWKKDKPKGKQKKGKGGGGGDGQSLTELVMTYEKGCTAEGGPGTQGRGEGVQALLGEEEYAELDEIAIERRADLVSSTMFGR